MLVPSLRSTKYQLSFYEYQYSKRKHVSWDEKKRRPEPVHEQHKM